MRTKYRGPSPFDCAQGQDDGESKNGKKLLGLIVKQIFRKRLRR
jgi:hypothetical protein